MATSSPSFETNELLTTDDRGTIVSFDCASAERYAFLPGHISRGTQVLAKVAYHPDAQRAFYRSRR